MWITADGEAVLDHDGIVRNSFRRKPLRTIARRDLPSHIPTLAELYDSCGTGFELSLDVKDPAAFDEVVDVSRRAGAIERLWLCHPSFDQLVEWRDRCRAARLVHSTRTTAFEHGPERHAAQLRDAGIDAVNLHHSEWTAGRTTLFHRFGRLALAWDAQHVRVIAALIDQGVDGVFSDHVDRMVESSQIVG